MKSGMKDLLIFVHWCNNDRLPALEAVLLNKRRISPEQKAIMRALENDARAEAKVVAKKFARNQSNR